MKSGGIQKENLNPKGVESLQFKRSLDYLPIKKFMSSYRQIYYQIVFGTKHRLPTITESHCTELYRYISGIVKKKNCKLYRINGVEDHIHIFSDLHPTICLSDYVKDIKIASSIWMKANGNFPKFEAWQEGYGAFTYSIREKDMIERTVSLHQDLLAAAGNVFKV